MAAVVKPLQQGWNSELHAAVPPSPTWNSLRHKYTRGLINYIDTKEKCRHLKKLTCKGTLRQVFIIDHRLEIKSVMLVFSTQLEPSLWFNSPTPLACGNKPVRGWGGV
jgi:hypothetical protein